MSKKPTQTLPHDTSSPDRAKITFVTCDDVPLELQGHSVAINKALEGKELPYEIVQFDDGSGAERYLKEKGNSKGVILITDGFMKRLTGFELLKNLKAVQLLPTNCVVCSSIDIPGYKDCMDMVKIDHKTVSFINKDAVRLVLPEVILKALPSAAAEVGLVYKAPNRPQTRKTAQRKRKPSGVD